MPPLVLDSFPLLVVFYLLGLSWLIREILCLLAGQLGPEFLSLVQGDFEGFLV